jgi:aspartate-semialdehyde dehydrogenase
VRGEILNSQPDTVAKVQPVVRALSHRDANAQHETCVARVLNLIGVEANQRSFVVGHQLVRDILPPKGRECVFVPHD